MAKVEWYEIISKDWINAGATEYWYLEDDTLENAVISLTACPFDQPLHDIPPDYRHPACKVAVERVYLELPANETGPTRRLHFAVRNLGARACRYSVYLSCVWP